MRKICIFFLLLSCTALSAQDVTFPQGQLPYDNPYAFGQDLSFVLNNERRGGVWWEPMQRGRGCFDDQTHVAKPILEAFEQYAYPLVRTDGNPRIWDFEAGERP